MEMLKMLEKMLNSLKGKWVFWPKVFVVLVVYIFLGEAATEFRDSPPAIVNATEGRTLHLKWIYQIDAADTSDFQRIRLGKYSGIAITDSYIQVSSSGVVGQISPRFQGRLNWIGDVSKGIAEFTISPVNETDAGEFTCALFRGFVKPSIASTVTLNILVKPGNLKLSETCVVHEIGTMTNITCSATGKPTPEITWHKTTGPGTVDPESVTQSAVGSSNLVFDSLTKENGAEYVCLARNPTKEDINGSVNVNVRYIESEMSTVLVCNTTELCCPVNGYPKPVYKWTLPNGNSSDKKCLPTKEEDYGIYTCEGSNSEGRAISVVTYCKAKRNVTVTPSAERNCSGKNRFRFDYTKGESYAVIGKKSGTDDVYFYGGGMSGDVGVHWFSLDKIPDTSSIELDFKVYHLETSSLMLDVIHRTVLILEKPKLRCCCASLFPSVLLLLTSLLSANLM